MSELDGSLWRRVWSRVWRRDDPRTPYISFDGKHYRVGFIGKDGTATACGMCDSLEGAVQEVLAKHAAGTVLDA